MGYRGPANLDEAGVREIPLHSVHVLVNPLYVVDIVSLAAVDPVERPGLGTGPLGTALDGQRPSRHGAHPALFFVLRPGILHGYIEGEFAFLGVISNRGPKMPADLPSPFPSRVMLSRAAPQTTTGPRMVPSQVGAIYFNRSPTFALA